MYIAIDFDGTIVTHEYPKIGRDIGAFEWLKKFQEYEDVKLILYAMRSGKELEEAVQYCRDNDVEFWSVNDNPDQYNWTTSRKIYAHIYIDDCNIFSPLLFDIKSNRNYLNWNVVGPRILQIIKSMC